MADWLDISDKVVKVTVGVAGLVLGESRLEAARDIMAVLTDGRDLMVDLSEPERDLAKVLRGGAQAQFEALSRQPDSSDGRLETARIHMEQALPFCMPSKEQIAALGSDPGPIAEAMADAAAAAQPDCEFAAYFRVDKPEMAFSRKFFVDAVVAVLKPLLDDPKVFETLEPALMRSLHRKVDEIPDRTAAVLIQELEKRGNFRRARDHHIEAVIIQIAKRISRRVEDFDQALKELDRAVDIAIEAEEAGERGSNLGAFVDDILKRVAERMRADDLDGASEVAEAGLAEWREKQAEMQAQGLRLLDTARDQALLRGDAAAAARHIAERVDMEGGEGSRFERLRAHFLEWFECGSDKGVNLDLAVSVELARMCLAGARDTDERGTALNDLGSALQTLGERESRFVRLEQAVAAYRAALEERTRERVPLDWAMTQMNLGNTLATLGERENGVARLEEAIDAYRSSLEERSRERVPLEWALTKMNLGTALKILGERESGFMRLEQAIAACHAALSELDRKRVPFDWAMAQMNLGNALLALGERRSDTTLLEEAVAAYHAALEVRTRELLASKWAMTQMNLGIALRIIGERESGTAQLCASISAFRLALEEWCRKRAPHFWAMTQGNLGDVEIALFEKTGDPAQLDRAEAHVEDALEVFRKGGATQYVGMAEEQLARIASLRKPAE